MVGRALPEGGPVALKKALVKHEKVLTTPIEGVDPDLLERAAIFGKEWGERFLKGTDFDPFSLEGGSGACLEHSRAKGGSRQTLVMSLDQPCYIGDYGDATTLAWARRSDDEVDRI